MPVIETSRSSATVRVIAKCRVKGCRAVASILVERTYQETISEAHGRHYRDHRLVNETLLEGPGEKPLGYGSTLRPVVPCEHGSSKVDVVRGRHSDTRKCDARCTGATGFDCECSCAGQNHGSAHAAV